MSCQGTHRDLGLEVPQSKPVQVPGGSLTLGGGVR